MSERDWPDYAGDMIQYLGHAIRITEGVSLDEFKSNFEKYLATSRAMEIAGEAAKHIPREIRLKYPQVEWQKLAGFRDVLAHGYLELDQEIIWDAAVVKAPVTLEALRRILTSERGE
ncbi:MAG TPA: DUF86 domain-containing protein [Longimicrobium sp.]|nr:DUF86 domain-containing protein [Longimicrobium sp.]